MTGLDGQRERIWLHGFVLTSCLIVTFLTAFSKVTIDFASFLPLVGACAFFYSVAALCHWRKIRFIGIICEMAGAGMLLTAPVLVSTYLAMSLALPLADQELIAMDGVLGFDWVQFIYYVNATPWLELLLANAYSSFSFQLLFIPVLLVVLGATSRACAFVFAYGLLCFISSFISIWYPAEAAYLTFNITQADVPNIKMKFGYYFLEDFYAVRENAAFTINLEAAAGIITYPSVHVGVACLAIWAMWENVYTRYPFLILNLLMNLSAVSHGSHYLVDVIAGAGVAAVTVAFTSWFMLGQRFEGFSRVVKSPPVEA